MWESLPHLASIKDISTTLLGKTGLSGCCKQCGVFIALETFLLFFNNLPTVSCQKHIKILIDPPKWRKLKIKLAVTAPFLRTTYTLEGDGMFAPSAYRQLQLSVRCKHYLSENGGRGGVLWRRSACGVPLYLRMLY